MAAIPKVRAGNLTKNKNQNVLLKRMNSTIFTHGCLILLCLNNTIQDSEQSNESNKATQ